MSGLTTSGVLWIIFVGFIAGIVARFLSPGPNKPTGFVLTTALGIAGAFLATWIGQEVGWYRANQGAGFIAASLGAIVVLFIWNRLVVGNVIRDPGNPGYDPRYGQGPEGPGGYGPGGKF